MCTIEAVDFHRIKNRKIAFDNSLDFFYRKRQCHEIFDHYFFA